MNTTMQVAETIRQQIGNGALAMLGASMLVGDVDSLMFAIKGCRKGNKLRIVLAADDTYTVELWKIRGVTFAKVTELSNVYADALHQVIESMTGLCTKI